MAAKKQITKDNQKQTAATENEKTQYKIPFITARIDRIASDVNSKIKANASVTIGIILLSTASKFMTAEKKGFKFSIPDIKVRMGSFMMTFILLQKNPAKHSTGMFLMPMSRKWNKCRLNSRLSPRNSTKMKNLLSSSQCNLFSKFIKSAGLFTDYQYSIDRGDVHENRKNARSPPRRTDNTEPYGVRCR